MPEKQTRERAQRAKREGKAPTTQAGEYVREEMHHAKRGKHPVKSRKQAIAIGLSKARKEGVDVPEKPKRASRKKAASKARGTPTTRRKSGGARGAASRTRSSRGGGTRTRSSSRGGRRRASTSRGKARR
jgi:hypothetical protein